jgi:hypothetical protein
MPTRVLGDEVGVERPQRRRGKEHLAVVGPVLDVVGGAQGIGSVGHGILLLLLPPIPGGGIITLVLAVAVVVTVGVAGLAVASVLRRLRTARFAVGGSLLPTHRPVVALDHARGIVIVIVIIVIIIIIIAVVAVAAAIVVAAAAGIVVSAAAADETETADDILGRPRKLALKIAHPFTLGGNHHDIVIPRLNAERWRGGVVAFGLAEVGRAKFFFFFFFFFCQSFLSKPRHIRIQHTKLDGLSIDICDTTTTTAKKKQKNKKKKKI